MFSIDKKTLKEIDAMQAMMKTLEKMGTAIEYAELKSRKHENHYPDVKRDPGLTNAEVLVYLADDSEGKGRDFISLDSGELQSVAQAYVDEARKRLARQAKGKSKIKSPKAQASNISTAAFKEAAMQWMKIAYDKIRSEGWTGSGPHSLNEQYEKKKREDVGFTHPIGTRSGQVEENLKPDKKNIRVKTS